MTSEYSPTNDQIDAVLDFAIKHKCVLNPAGWTKYLEGYNRKGHCLCDKKRLQCPCDEAPAEIKRQAKCLCGLFWSSYEAYAIARSLRGAAVGVRVKVDKERPEEQPENAVEPEMQSRELIAMLTFLKCKESMYQASDFVRLAVSYLTNEAMAYIDEVRSIRIRQWDDGSIDATKLPWSGNEPSAPTKRNRGWSIYSNSDEAGSDDRDNIHTEPSIEKPEKLEALFDFGKREEAPPPNLQRFVESAANILSIGTGIVLDPGQRMIISRNQDGSLSLDVSYNLSLTEPAGKDTGG